MAAQWEIQNTAISYQWHVNISVEKKDWDLGQQNAARNAESAYAREIKMTAVSYIMGCLHRAQTISFVGSVFVTITLFMGRTATFCSQTICSVLNESIVSAALAIKEPKTL